MLEKLVIALSFVLSFGLIIVTAVALSKDWIDLPIGIFAFAVSAFLWVATAYFVKDSRRG